MLIDNDIVSECDLRLGAEDQGVRGAAEVEHPQLIARADCLTIGDAQRARRHLRHANADEAHESDGRVGGADEDQRSHSGDREPRLGANQGTARVVLRKIGVVRRCTVVGNDSVVRPWNDDSLFDDAVDGGCASGGSPAG